MRIAEIGGEDSKLGRAERWKSFILKRFLESWERIGATDQAVNL